MDLILSGAVYLVLVPILLGAIYYYFQLYRVLSFLKDVPIYPQLPIIGSTLAIRNGYG